MSFHRNISERKEAIFSLASCGNFNDAVAYCHRLMLDYSNDIYGYECGALIHLRRGTRGGHAIAAAYCRQCPESARGYDVIRAIAAQTEEELASADTSDAYEAPMRLQFEDNGTSHDDLFLVFPDAVFECDSYYLSVDQLLHSTIDGPEKVRFVLSTLLRQWYDAVRGLGDGDVVRLPFGYFDEYTEYIVCRAIGDDIELEAFASDVAGYTHSPSDIRQFVLETSLAERHDAARSCRFTRASVLAAIDNSQAAALQRQLQTQTEYRSETRKFYDSLGEERSDFGCKSQGCTRGAVAHSVFCRTHHCESVWRRPCIFRD